MSFKSIFKIVTIFPLIIFTSAVYSIDDIDNKEGLESIAKARKFISEHKGKFNGKSMSYTVTAGETYLRDKNGKKTASIFTFAYTAKNKKMSLDQ